MLTNRNGNWNLDRTARALRLTASAGALAAMASVGACSGSVSIGGSDAVAEPELERRVATALAEQVNRPTPNIDCPGDLAAEVDASIQCVLTVTGDTTRYPVNVRVTSVNGDDDVQFSAQVGTTPLPAGG
ncbi:MULTISPECIES: DUF4333 domain-containing protein [unclassified Parafrankia]|uniref:DUF4333 domain-containing protein n=1 Tax=unclassified Parafrankia TaxID=2994368 RepID=UPI000DA48310|nr:MULTISPECIES: DUF4333 domain-containing protein [unclassified Parafrankia]TCJ32199.1 DUF4333 domain-containing protein [Parafrankia sp. BMG5.11]SQE00427.1 conserved exported hypothetical protein [Parafrankia sp. Ea1.12]